MTAPQHLREPKTTPAIKYHCCHNPTKHCTPRHPTMRKTANSAKAAAGTTIAAAGDGTTGTAAGLGPPDASAAGNTAPPPSTPTGTRPEQRQETQAEAVTPDASHADHGGSAGNGTDGMEEDPGPNESPERPASKRGRTNENTPVDRQTDPLAAAEAKTRNALDRIKEKKRQSKLTFNIPTDNGGKEGRPHEAAATRPAAGQAQARIDTKDVYVVVETKATPSIPPKKAVRAAIGALLDNLGNVRLDGLDGEAKAIKSKGALPVKWQDGLEASTAVEGGKACMLPVRGGGGKFRRLKFTVRVRCPTAMDVGERLDSASIDLADDDLTMEVKNIACAHDKSNIIVLMSYTALGDEYSQQAIATALNRAYKGWVASQSWTKPRKERMLAVTLKVAAELCYPPHGEYKQYKKGEARPKYRASNKRAYTITYDAAKETAIRACMESGLWKKEMRAMGLGRHVFVREVPGDDAEGPTVARFREDCDIHLVTQSSATYGYLVGVTNLELQVDITIEGDGDESAQVVHNLSLRQVLWDVEHNGKPLLRALAEQRNGSVIAVVCEGDGRGERLTNMTSATAAWVMYHLLFEVDATSASVEHALTCWFSQVHRVAATNFSEYDQETGHVSMTEPTEEDVEGSEAQEAIAEGILDLSILDNPPAVSRGSATAAAHYDSDEDAQSRASIDTAAWGRKLYGLTQATIAKRHTKNGTKSGDSDKTESGTAAGDAKRAAATVPTEGVPLPPANMASDAGASKA